MTPTKADREKAKALRLAIAHGIFTEKWSSDEVDEKETELIAQALADQREEDAKIAESLAPIGYVKIIAAAIRGKGKP